MSLPLRGHRAPLPVLALTAFLAATGSAMAQDAGTGAPAEEVPELRLNTRPAPRPKPPARKQAPAAQGPSSQETPAAAETAPAEPGEAKPPARKPKPAPKPAAKAAPAPAPSPGPSEPASAPPAPTPAAVSAPPPAEPPSACGAQAALYEGAKNFSAHVTRLGRIEVENPLRPLTPDVTRVLQVTIGGKSATAFGPEFDALRRGPAPSALEAQLGGSVRWEAALPLLPPTLTIVSEAGETLARLSFRACTEAPAVKAPPPEAARKPAARSAGKGDASRGDASKGDVPKAEGSRSEPRKAAAQIGRAHV